MAATVRVAPLGVTQPDPPGDDLHIIAAPVADQPTPRVPADVPDVFLEAFAEREVEISATPAELLLGTLPHPGLRLRAPLRVEVQRDGDSVGVWAPELEELGYGPHLTAAIEDFQQTLIELYLSLEAESGRLGPSMAALREQLQQVIERRP